MPQNRCAGLKAEKREIPGWEWHEPLPFKLSNTGLQRYSNYRNHRPVMNYAEKPARPTFNVTAIQTLESRYPEDPLYRVIANFRRQQKLLTAYIGQTVCVELNVPDDYKLMDGEKWADESQ